MKALRMKKAHVFAEQLHGGNPAGIVFLEEELLPREMMLMAGILNPVSETVFISPSEKADYRFQYFTPTAEIEICGHATIGAYFAMYKDLTSKNEKETLLTETKIGVFPVTLHFARGILSRAMMKQAHPEFSTTPVDVERLTRILNIAPDDLDSSLPLQVVSTGRPKLMVPLRTRKTLNTLHPDFNEMIAFCHEVKATGIHPFTFETEDKDSLVHCRHFAPTVGVNEDPATGNGNAALGAYLFRLGRLDKEAFIAEQGYAMGRPSKLVVEVDQKGEVSVGGSARIVMEGTILV